MKYFTYAETIASQTARERGLDNTPSPEHRRNIETTVEECLDPLREGWAEWCRNHALGTPAIRISSGYRGFRLNAAVGGSSTSAHCVGLAFDLVPMNGNNLEFKKFCRTWFASHPFDQLISESEYADGVPVWIHVGYKNRAGAQRRQMLTMRGGKYIPMT